MSWCRHNPQCSYERGECCKNCKYLADYLEKNNLALAKCIFCDFRGLHKQMSTCQDCIEKSKDGWT
jgi:hypothetical protein